MNEKPAFLWLTLQQGCAPAMTATAVFSVLFAVILTNLLGCSAFRAKAAQNALTLVLSAACMFYQNFEDEVLGLRLSMRRYHMPGDLGSYGR